MTEQQKLAVNAENCSIIVSAAAGSGKTTVLTERLSRILSDPDAGVRADRIVIVTFTNDAASELKKRLEAKLTALINENPSDTYLLRQQVLLKSAKISTINSFCFDLIRDNIEEQGVTSGFTVLDDTDNKVLKSQAMDDLIDYYCANEYDKISYLYDKFCIADEKRLINLINCVDEFLESEAFRDRWLDMVNREYAKDFRDSSYYTAFINTSLKKIRRAKMLADENLVLVPKIFPDIYTVKTAVKVNDQSQNDCEKTDEILFMIENGNIPTSEDIERLTNFGKKVTVRKDTDCNHALEEVYKKNRTEFIETAKQVVKSAASAESDFYETAEITKILSEVIRKYHDFIWQRKIEKNALSFDDGERITLELLADFDGDGNIIQSETAKNISRQYDVIMIDEYQDSNNKQDMIFKLLSRNFGHNSDGQPLYGDNVFLVGDVKQSIYGFRLANPENFISTFKNSERYNPGSTSKNQSVVLGMNFRSSEPVIDFINYIFSNIMSEECGGVDYNDDERLYFGAERYRSTDDCKTHITFVNDDPLEDGGENSDNTDNPEAVCTAEKIASMIKQGYTVLDERGKTRPCRPSDFCILVRKNKFSAEYVKQLSLRGIAAKGADKKGYLKSREISILIDLLRIINNPLLDVPLTAVLMSPMYMFTAAETAYIKSFDRERAVYSLLRDIADCGYGGFSDDNLLLRIKKFLKSFDGYRLDAVTMTLGELINSIYEDTDFISVMQLYSDGEKKRANLRSLIQYAKNYEENSAAEGSGGLGGFLRHIDRIMKNKDDEEGKSAPQSGDYVTIQTIHASKGLEYPFVFLVENFEKFRNDTSDIAACSTDGRIGYILFDSELMRKYKTFQKVILNEEKRRESVSEEMRLLYVALTRAKQKLFINLKCGEKSLKRLQKLTDNFVVNMGDIKENVISASSYSDWLWSCLMLHSSFGDIAERLDLDYYENSVELERCDDDVFEYEFYDNIPHAEEENQETNEVKIMPDEDVYNKLSEIIKTHYDDTLSKMPAKLSVTQISHKFSETEAFDFSLRRPAFISGKSKLTGAERGTAIHTFLQYCDFDRAKASPADEIERIHSLGYISEIQAQSISTGKISAFFGSSLYKRLVSANSCEREKKFMVAVAQLNINNDLMNKLRKSDGMIKGIIDLMFEEDDGIVIVDYKSDRGISADKLKERYTPQLRLYKSAVEITTGKKVKELCLYSIELEKTVNIEMG
ncbi:MAG: helicase-exonuclease AddAB subunit AddA [Ruminococcus sp.]|nr:helicase-exonuclease AddAB subunit AddA [Ruminococcus sp.]